MDDTILVSDGYIDDSDQFDFVCDDDVVIGYIHDDRYVRSRLEFICKWITQHTNVYVNWLDSLDYYVYDIYGKSDGVLLTISICRDVFGNTFNHLPIPMMKL